MGLYVYGINCYNVASKMPFQELRADENIKILRREGFEFGVSNDGSRIFYRTSQGQTGTLPLQTSPSIEDDVDLKHLIEDPAAGKTYLVTHRRGTGVIRIESR